MEGSGAWPCRYAGPAVTTRTRRPPGRQDRRAPSCPPWVASPHTLPHRRRRTVGQPAAQRGYLGITDEPLVNQQLNGAILVYRQTVGQLMDGGRLDSACLSALSAVRCATHPRAPSARVDGQNGITPTSRAAVLVTLTTTAVAAKRELQPRPKVHIFFKSFELLDGNVPIFRNTKETVPALAATTVLLLLLLLVTVTCHVDEVRLPRGRRVAHHVPGTAPGTFSFITEFDQIWSSYKRWI